MPNSKILLDECIDRRLARQISGHDVKTAPVNDWHQRMANALQLNGKGERTQEAYTRPVRMLAQFYDKTPDLVTEQELQGYSLQRKNVNQWSPFK